MNVKNKKEKISIDLSQRIRSLRDESLKSERIWAGFGRKLPLCSDSRQLVSLLRAFLYQ